MPHDVDDAAKLDSSIGSRADGFATAELDKRRLLLDTPKSRAGRRVVAFPAELVPDLRWHLERFAEPGSGLVFVGPKGGALRSDRGDRK